LLVCFKTFIYCEQLCNNAVNYPYPSNAKIDLTPRYMLCWSCFEQPSPGAYSVKKKRQDSLSPLARQSWKSHQLDPSSLPHKWEGIYNNWSPGRNTSIPCATKRANFLQPLMLHLPNLKRDTAIMQLRDTRYT
jgi:hypothetical protein